MIPKLSSFSKNKTWRTRLGKIRRSHCASISAVDAWYFLDPNEYQNSYRDSDDICNCVYSKATIVADDETVGVLTLSTRLPEAFFDQLLIKNFHQVMKLQRLHIPTPRFRTTMQGVSRNYRIEHQIRCNSCGKFVRKIYMPFGDCEEENDARTAEVWLRAQAQNNRPYTNDEMKIVNRYADLFSRRCFRCRVCMRLSYR